MKIKYLLLSVTLALLTVACEKKTEVSSVSTPSAAPIVEGNTQKILPKREPATHLKKETVKAEKSTAIPTENSATAPSPAPVTQTTEETLADVSKYGREVTKTQTSKTRTRAQQAEDDMMKDLQNDK